jgi:hypothetical protein
MKVYISMQLRKLFLIKNCKYTQYTLTMVLNYLSRGKKQRFQIQIFRFEKIIIFHLIVLEIYFNNLILQSFISV